VDLGSKLTVTWKGDGVRRDAVQAVVHVAG
jgi:hypothetical protein